MHGDIKDSKFTPMAESLYIVLDECLCLTFYQIHIYMCLCSCAFHSKLHSAVLSGEVLDNSRNNFVHTMVHLSSGVLGEIKQ